MYLDLLILHLIIVYIIDISGISLYIKKRVFNFFFKKWKFQNKKYYDLELKPFLCSTCMTFWICSTVVLLIDPSIINLGYAALLSWMAPISSEMIQVIRDIILNILQKINK